MPEALVRELKSEAALMGVTLQKYVLGILSKRVRPDLVYGGKREKK